MRAITIFLVSWSVCLFLAVPVFADTYEVAKVYRDYPGYINPAVCDNENMSKPTANPAVDMQKPTGDPAKASETTLYRIPSENPIGAFYVGINAGATWVDDADFSIQGDDTDAELSFDAGYGVGLAFGHSYTNGMRSEVEVFYRANDIDEFSTPRRVIDAGESDGEVTSWGAMINGYYDFPASERIKPFIGAGIGYANVEYDSDNLEDSVDDDVFAYQAMAGCGIAVSKEVTIDLQYRFLATDDPEFDDSGIEVETEYMTHNVMLGLRFSF